MTASTPETIPESGGSGQPVEGTLILKNMDAITNDGDSIPLGSFLTTDQQSTINAQLESIVRLKKDRSVYEGTVVDKSVSVKYDTNDVTFSVHIDDPMSDYTVVINTISDVIVITDSDGKKVN